MKITDWAIIFVLLVSPMLWLGSLHIENIREMNRLDIRYTTALKTSAQDGGQALNRNELQRFENGYGSDKWMRADKEQALAAFLQTMYVNFGVADDLVGQQALLAYIPAVVVLDYDGYYVYAARLGPEYDQESSLTHRWGAKKPYVYADPGGNSMSFTLDRYVTVYDAAENRWLSGRQDELKDETAIPLLQDDSQFDAVRRSVIVHSIEQDLEQAIHLHNDYAARQGVRYTFTLPTISQEEWNNTLDDVGIIAFLQGIPVGDRYYNNYALGGGRLVRSSAVLGLVDLATGMKYYERESCATTEERRYQVQEVFASEQAAAAKGYFAANCRRLE
ncbi:hypothetical protein [Paenibacillus sanguinis]|uniref:hypothetical protein n=1 Tax=Paenibacillus sanguinis TaxID=225906 RepID=UPI000363B5CF|nr:hypothetical protein [Paenibacillus sanguinis]